MLKAAISRQRCPARYPSLNSEFVTLYAIQNSLTYVPQPYRTLPSACSLRRCTRRRLVMMSSRSRCCTTRLRVRFALPKLHQSKCKVAASEWSVAVVKCCSRYVLYLLTWWVLQNANHFAQQAFERMVDLRIFLPAAAPAASIAKEFALHRCAIDRLAVKKAVEQMGQLNLRKWLTKA